MATKQIAWNTGSGNITLTYQGQGNGTITVNSDSNDLDTARSQTITVQTLDGVIARNLTVSQAACLVPIGTVFNYAYTGSYQEVTLPAGKYKLQCWGAQGGSNAAASSYSITAQAGGKGGYSEGIITLSQATTLRIYVGGQGSSSAGGFNGGGSTTGSSSYNSGGTNGVSRMGGGGGATDIRLSDGSLYSRMIVAGGGSGGAMSYKAVTASTKVIDSTVSTYTIITSLYSYNAIMFIDVPIKNGVHYYVEGTGVFANTKGDAVFDYYDSRTSSGLTNKVTHDIAGQNDNDTAPDRKYLLYWIVRDNAWAKRCGYNSYDDLINSSWTLTLYHYEDKTTTTNVSQVGYGGGGTTGVAYSSTYQGKQNSAGSYASFGQGANMTTSNTRYCSGSGGGGWYGGGAYAGDSDINRTKMSGGGSGWVNTSASASNRPSGYTGLQLDSGTTYAGNTSFESTSGGTETGHAGNGYARITRIS